MPRTIVILTCNLCKHKKERCKEREPSASMCSHFEITGFFYCAKTANVIPPHICSYRYYNNAQTFGHKCKIGKSLVLWMYNQGETPPVRDKKWTELYEGTQDGV